MLNLGIAYGAKVGLNLRLLKTLLINNQDIFSRHNYDVQKTTLTQHQIPVQDGTKPIKMNPYRESPEQEKEIERQLKQMMGAGLDEQGRGTWSFPVVLARKKNGDWRLCVDHKKQHTARRQN